MTNLSGLLLMITLTALLGMPSNGLANDGDDGCLAGGEVGAADILLKCPEKETCGKPSEEMCLGSNDCSTCSKTKKQTEDDLNAKEKKRCAGRCEAVESKTHICKMKRRCLYSCICQSLGTQPMKRSKIVCNSTKACECVRTRKSRRGTGTVGTF